MRVLLLEMPQLLRGILEQAIRVSSDCELAADRKRGFLSLPEPTPPPDVVILGLSGGEDTTLVSALFARWPHAHVMTVTQAGNDVVLYEFSPRRHELGEISPAEMVEMLRDVVRRHRDES